MPMLSSESGNVTPVSAVWLNARLPIFFSPLPNVTVSSEAQLSNALSPMVSSESGKVTLISGALSNARLPIDFSPLPNVTVSSEAQ